MNLTEPHRHGLARLAAWLGLLACLTASAAADPFVAGADMSLLSYFESNGIAYRDNGQVGDALAILKHHGVNCIRLRLFTSGPAQASADPYDYINNLAYTLPLAVRVKNAGLKFMLDFHYSDTWADPGHQTTPAAWTSLSFTQLVSQMRIYDSNCIAAFRAAGALPDYVQVGNEITGGLLWTNGAVPGNNAATQWPKLAQLLTAATQGIRDAAGTQMPKVIVHIDSGADWPTTQWFFDNLIQTQHVACDILGFSYYPFYHGSPGALANCLTNAAWRYGKPIFVAETAFPWTNNVWTTNLYGFTGTTNGQAAYTLALVQIVKNVPQNLGGGIFWWGTEYQDLYGVGEAGFDTASFFDTSGNVLPAADVLGQAAAPLWLQSSLAGTNLNLQWPLSGTGLGLTTATNLSPSATWTPVQAAVAATGMVYQTSVPLDAVTNRFYRLQTN